MKIIFKVSGILFASVFLFSCLSQSGNDLKEVMKKEKSLKANRQDGNLAAQLDAAYKNYIQKYPEDTNVPRMLFEDAQINIYPLNKTNAALDQLGTLYTKFPKYRLAPDALFKSAFLNEKAQRYEKAKSQYLLFVKIYPDNELAGQAKDLAGMTGLSEDEQFKQVMAKRNLIQDSVKNQKKVQK